MDLKTARTIARQVGATIEQRDPQEFLVKLGVCRMCPNGAREYPQLFAPTPQIAATLAVIETGKASMALASVAKQVYVDSDLIFGASQ